MRSRVFYGTCLNSKENSIVNIFATRKLDAKALKRTAGIWKDSGELLIKVGPWKRTIKLIKISNKGDLKSIEIKKKEIWKNSYHWKRFCSMLEEK